VPVAAEKKPGIDPAFFCGRLLHVTISGNIDSF
jgi:hypothetical protein